MRQLGEGAMRIDRIAALTMVLTMALALALPAAAFPFSYAREHPAACAEAWEKKTMERSSCGSRDFCADLTGSFCAKRIDRNWLGREHGDAEEEAYA
jgi:hypothetical protein